MWTFWLYRLKLWGAGAKYDVEALPWLFFQFTFYGFVLGLALLEIIRELATIVLRRRKLNGK